jgi:hypothetical protein
MTMSAKSKAYLVGGGIGSLAAARPGSVGVLDPYIPNQVHHDAELHHFRKLRWLRGSDERVVSGGQVKFREDIVVGLEKAPQPSSACWKARISASCWTHSYYRCAA